MKAQAQQLAINFRPMKPREPGSAKAVISDLYNQVGGVPEVMLRFGIGRSQAHAFTDPLSPEKMSFERVMALTGPNATAAVEAMAARAGGLFTPLPSPVSAPPLTLTAASVREHGEAIAEALNVLAGGKASPSTKAKVVREIDEAICVLAALRGSFLATEADK